MPSAQTARLAPMTVADILDNAVALFKAHWRPVSLVTLLLSIPVGLVSVVAVLIIGDEFAPGADVTSITGLLSMGNLVAGAIFAFLAGELVSIFVTSFAIGFTTRLVAGSLLGQEMSTRRVLRSVLSLWPALIVVTLITDVSVAVAAVGGLFVLFAGILVTVPFVMVILTAAIPVVIVEEVGPLKAIKRSVRLCLKGFWVYAFAILFSVIVQFVFTLAITQLGQLFVLSAEDSMSLFVIVLQSMLDVIASAISTVITAIVATLVYLDARVRFEGFDIRLQMARLGDAGTKRIQPAE